MKIYELSRVLATIAVPVFHYFQSVKCKLINSTLVHI